MIKLLKIYQLQVRIAWELTGSVWKLRRSFKKQPEIKWNLYTYLFPVLLQNKQKSIWNSSKTNLWLTPRPILWNITSNTLRKKPGEAFQASFKLPRCGWDQRLANFNRFLQQKQIYYYMSMSKLIWEIDIVFWQKVQKKVLMIPFLNILWIN